VGLDGFESQTSQTSSHFFPIPSNPCVLGITEQALNDFIKEADLVSQGKGKKTRMETTDGAQHYFGRFHVSWCESRLRFSGKKPVPSLFTINLLPHHQKADMTV
jgi:hypothetical protein